MSNLTKLFFSFFILLNISLVFIGLDILNVDTKKEQNIKEFASISKLPNSVLSITFYEPRIREYKDLRYKLYDGMEEINYMDFTRR